jgi:hypothetical protein
MVGEGEDGEIEASGFDYLKHPWDVSGDVRIPKVRGVPPPDGFGSLPSLGELKQVTLFNRHSSPLAGIDLADLKQMEVGARRRLLPENTGGYPTLLRAAARRRQVFMQNNFLPRLDPLQTFRCARRAS